MIALYTVLRDTIIWWDSGATKKTKESSLCRSASWCVVGSSFLEDPAFWGLVG